MPKPVPKKEGETKKRHKRGRKRENPQSIFWSHVLGRRKGENKTRPTENRISRKEIRTVYGFSTS